MLGYKYSGWDGTQTLELDAEDILDALSDDILEQGDLRQALRRMTQRGMRGQNLMGLQEMLQRIKQRRQQQLERYNLDSSVDALKEALEEILRLEQEGIQRRLDQARNRTQPPGDNDPSADQPQDPSQGNAETSEPGDQPPASGARSGAPRSQGQQGQSGQPSQSPGSQGQGEGYPDGISPEQAQRLREFMERMAAEKLDFLKGLPPELGGALTKLKDYDFWDSEAKQKYDELMDQLKQQMAQQMFQGMQQGMQGMQQGMSQEQMQAMRQMMQDLNQMLRDRLEGLEPNFEQFTGQWGEAFGPNPPQSLDELLDQLQDRAQQMQSLMESLSPEQRAELQQLSESMMQEMGLQDQMAELAASLSQLFPQDRPSDYQFRGDDPVTLQEAMRLMEEMAKTEELEASLKRAQTGADIPDADVAAMRELLGEEEAQQLENLRDLAKKLEEAGFAQRKGDRLELTPRGIRKLGQKALRDIFEKLKKDRVGNHQLERRGVQGDSLQETKPYEFGDPFLLDLEKTVRNAVERGGPGIPVRLGPEDFEIFRTEHQTQCTTVLLLDQSRSMGYTGRFLAAKKVALALQSLIRGQFPRDNLYVVGFSAYATEIKQDDLAKVTWNYDASGTNMQHALMLSRQYLAKHKGGTKQIIMVTDGEPTAHLERGYAYFAYPPTHRTIQETLREVRRCTREGITINTFMLEQSYYLVEFMGQVAKLNRGRVFYSSPESLGQYVLVDYLGQKKRKAG
ncbi:MAG: VWA domain-containing protein [Dehalococcoidia bacterium]|nr:VWA domain-containing protein [Dehalococcoidia bacterium]